MLEHWNGRSSAARPVACRNATVRLGLMVAVLVGVGPAVVAAIDFFGLPANPAVHERSSPWFGLYNDEHFDHLHGEGWIAHREHGWLYVSGTGFGQGFWMWDHIWERWWWTRQDVYPFLYHDEDGAWWYYDLAGEPSGRALYEYGEDGEGHWSTVHFFGRKPDPFADDDEEFWFGSYDDADFDHREKRGWIDHQEHGRIYVRGRNFEQGFWFWDAVIEDWLWTRADIYPFLYSDDRNGWLYYHVGGGPESRRFFDYQAGQEGEWIDVEPE